ncbi:MAG: hypothetical protein KAS32_16230, partial [Candidatus Peribacteraceae bacterium]|nr:hypothetical protein [Candidatus Peribacteraceae bacterium]
MNVYDKIGQYGSFAFDEGNTRKSNGNIWFVNSASGNAGNTTGTGVGESWDLPFATLNYAISRSVAGDVIVLASAHAETIQDAGTSSGTTTDELVVDKPGITIVGIGRGTRRPTFTLSGATDASMVLVSGANDVEIKNLIFVSDLADVAAAITVDAAADGVLIENCSFRDGGSSKELVIGVSVAANADDVTIRGCRFNGTDTADNASAIKLVGASIRTQIYDNVFRGDWETAAIDGVTAAAVDTLVVDNKINNLDAAAGLCISLHANSTGTVDKNTVHGGNSAVNAIAAGNCLLGKNTIVNAVGIEGGADLPASGRVTKTYTNWTGAPTQHTLFNIVGGPVKITSLVGIVTGTIKSASIDIALEAVPTAPGTDLELASVLAIDADAIGTLYTLNATPTGILVATTTGALADPGWDDIVCAVGAIVMECTGEEDGDGAI